MIRIPFLVCSLAALMAADALPAPATVAALVDVSRTSGRADLADRTRFLVDGVLPLTTPGRSVWLVGREVVPASDLAAVTYRQRWSAWHTAFAAVVAPLSRSASRSLVVLAGDGDLDAAYPGMPVADLAGLKPEPTRDAINAAILARLAGERAALVADPRLTFVMLDGSAAASAPVFDWIRSLRSDAAVVDLDAFSLTRAVEALAAAGVVLPGREAVPPGLLPVGGGSMSIPVPEGTTRLDLLLASRANDPGWSVAFSDAHGPLPATGDAARAVAVDGDGVARLYRIEGMDAGGTLRLNVTSATAAIEVIARRHTAIQHRLSVEPIAPEERLLAGDAVRVVHRFVRAPGETPVSPATVSGLRVGAELHFGSATQSALDGVRLPAVGGSASVALVLSASASDVSSAPVTVRWSVVEPLQLSGGFTVAEAYDGDAVGVRLVQRGGRRAVASTELTLRADGLPDKSVQVSLAPGATDAVLTGSVTFTAAERALWRLSASATGVRESASVVASPGAHDAVSVVRNWWPIIIAAIVALALGLLAWWLWWRNLPRFVAHLLQNVSGLHPLKDCPGERARDTSLGLPAFERAIVLKATRAGTVLAAINAPALVWINAKPASVDQLVPEGADIEVQVKPGRKVHARYFAHPDQVRTGLPPAINAQSGLGDVHVILDA